MGSESSTILKLDGCNFLHCIPHLVTYLKFAENLEFRLTFGNYILCQFDCISMTITKMKQGYVTKDEKLLFLILHLV